jgi:hypothetical protein
MGIATGTVEAGSAAFYTQAAGFAMVQAFIAASFE